MTALWIGLGVAFAGAVIIGLGGEWLRRRLGRAKQNKSSLGSVWQRLYALNWGEVGTNNYGFAPAEGNHPERFQHQMYRELLKRLRAKRPLVPGMSLLEVGCGRGGGLMALLEEAGDGAFDATGLDIAASAIAYAQATHRRSGLRFMQGNGLDLPFADRSFDVVLNVEASKASGDRPAFLREVARVLKPNGVLLLADSARARRVERLAGDLAQAGFTAELEDITENVVAACRADSGRRKALLARTPLLARTAYRGALANYAGVEGSKRFRDFETGAKRYLMTVAERA